MHANFVSRLSSFFPHHLFILVVLFFSEWKFWGRLVLPVPGEQFQAQRVGWGMGGGLKRDSKKSRGKFRYWTGNEGASKQLPCVLYFSWGLIANGARRELARPSTRHTSTVCAHTRKRKTYILCPLFPTTSTDYKPIQSRGLYFPRVCCQFGLITLPRFGLWQYNKTLRFTRMQDCLTKPWIYTYFS